MGEHGGHVKVEGGGPGACDLSIIAPQGHSAAVYLSAKECRELAVQLLALGFGCRPTRVTVFSRKDRYNEIVVGGVQGFAVFPDEAARILTEEGK